VLEERILEDGVIGGGAVVGFYFAGGSLNGSG